MKQLYILLITFLITTLSFGQVILSEDFSYPDGSLVGNGTWANHSGTAGDMLVASGQVQVQHGTPSEDANIPFTSVTGDIYFGIDFVVADLGAPYSGTDNEYFANFKNDGFTLVGRLDIVAPSGAGDFSVGISSSSSTANETWANDLAYGTTYRAIVRYNQDSGTSQLWIDPTASTDTSISGGTGTITTVTQFALRQSDSSENELVTVDNLIVSQSFDLTLSVVENQIKGFSMYPNPVVEGKFVISSNSRENKTVEIYSMLGQQVFSKSVQANETVDVSNLNNGIYLMRVTEGGKIATRKLVIK